MRRNGKRLSQAQLEAERPTQGRLWVTNMRAFCEGDYRPLTASLLGQRGHGEQPFWKQLERARVKIRDGQVMVLGYEDHGFNDKSPRPVAQVWWCDPMHDPLDEAEAAAKARFPPTLGRARHNEAAAKRREAWDEGAHDGRLVAQGVASAGID